MFASLIEITRTILFRTIITFSITIGYGTFYFAFTTIKTATLSGIIDFIIFGLVNFEFQILLVDKNIFFGKPFRKLTW